MDLLRILASSGVRGCDDGTEGASINAGSEQNRQPEARNCIANHIQAAAECAGPSSDRTNCPNTSYRRPWF